MTPRKANLQIAPHQRVESVEITDYDSDRFPKGTSSRANGEAVGLVES